MKKLIKPLISRFLFKYLFNLVLEEEILKYNPKTGDWFYNGNKLTKEQVHALADQARAIQRMDLWRMLMKEMQHLANDKIFNKSLSFEDGLGGKFMLYTIDVLSKKVYNIGIQK